MELVKSMTKIPGVCLSCGGNPPDPTDSRKQRPAIDLDVDINWGDNAYICGECADLIADLIDRPSRARVKKVRDRVKFAEGKNKQLVAENETMKSQLDRIRIGREAVREVKDGS